MEIIKKIKIKLKEEKGVSTTIGFLFGIVIFFMVVYFFIIVTNMYSTSKATRDSIEQGVIGTIEGNYRNVYHSGRESYTVGYVPSNNDFKENILIKESDIYRIIKENLGLMKNKNSSYVRLDNNKSKVFSIDNIEVNIVNKELKSDTIKFVADIKYDFTYYINFIGYESELKIPMKIRAKYTGKF